MDVAQGEGRGAVGVELDAVVLVGGVRAGERACSLELPDAGGLVADEPDADREQQLAG